MIMNQNQIGSITPDEATAEIDIRNLDTNAIRHMRVYTREEALRFRVGMRISPKEFVDAVWLFPDSLGRDYKIGGAND